jgi:hypothetical protein
LVGDVGAERCGWREEDAVQVFEHEAHRGCVVDHVVYWDVSTLLFLNIPVEYHNLP